MGLASAVWGGFFAALLGGSQFNIAGPTASGAGILAVYSLRYGYQILPFIAIISGLLMLAVLALRLDRYVLLLPGGVMHGWTIGVAFTIAGNQLAAAFGLNGLKRHEQFFMNMFEVFAHLRQTQVGPFIVFLIAVIAIVSLGFYRPKVPWTIIVALIGIFMGVLSANEAWFFHMDTLNDRYAGLKFFLFQTPTFKSTFFTGEILTASFSIAFISILESLLSAKVADRITGTRFAQPLEVFGIALANIIAGTFNGIPVTAALARTALNINSGATNRMAAILNGVSCGVISLLLIRALGYMPLAIIAALLVNVAIRMVNLANLTHLWLYDSTMFRIAVFTALVTIFMDPAQGIIYGAVVSIFLHGLHTASAYSEITAGNDAVPVVTHSSMELDRQALQDTFERQFPPTKGADEENAVEMVSVEELHPPRRPRRRAGASAAGGRDSGVDADARDGSMMDPEADDHDEDFVALDSDYESDDEDQEHVANRVFITAPKYKADHLVVRFPGEISYLNAEQHADRLAPLLNTGRYLILHLKRTYYIDMDGMDALTAMVHKVEKLGNHIIISGVTPQILPNLEILDWFVRAREENRIVANYKGAILRIRELDTARQRLLDERNYHDISAYEVEESRRHAQYLANVEAARVNREARIAKEQEEARQAAEALEAKEAAEEAARAAEAERRQASLAAKRKADAEEFQRRLEEYERNKKQREASKAAYLAASAEAEIAGGPSITVPHHKDHHLPPRRANSGLKLMEAPAQPKEQEAEPSTPTPAPETIHEEPQQEKQQEELAQATSEEEKVEEPEAETPKTQVTIESPRKEETPASAAEEPAVAEPVAEEPAVVTEEPKEPVVEEPAPAIEEQKHEEAVAEPEEVAEQVEESPAESAPAEVEEVPETTEKHVTFDEPEESKTEEIDLGASEPQEDTAPTTDEEQVKESAPEEPASDVEPETAPIVEEPFTEHGHVDVPVPQVDEEDDHEAVVYTESAPAETTSTPPEISTPPETSTPPPESETSSIASDGPQGLQLSPRLDHPEPVAPLDEEDPFADAPAIPRGDSAPGIGVLSEHFKDAAEQAPQEHSAPSSTIDFMDPFAEFGDASTTSTPAASAPATPAKPSVASTHSSVPSTPIGHSDYVDPFDQFGIIPDDAPSHSAPSSVPSSVPATPQKDQAPIDVDFDPFAELLSPSAQPQKPAYDEEDDEDQLL